MKLLSPTSWKDYELVDSGEGEKLERFGKFITIRPEPQALWNPVLSEKEWEKMAHVKFIAVSSSSGKWKKLKEIPDRWNIEYPVKNTKNSALRFRLALTSFKHVGIFPEQASNWDYIIDCVSKMKTPSPRVLNLFA